MNVLLNYLMPNLAAVLVDAREETGQTMMEYALLLLFIAAVVVVGATALGINLGTLFTDAANSF